MVNQKLYLPQDVIILYTLVIVTSATFNTCAVRTGFSSQHKKCVLVPQEWLAILSGWKVIAWNEFRNDHLLFIIWFVITIANGGRCGVQVYYFNAFVDKISAGVILPIQLSSSNYDFIGSLDVMASVTEAGHLQFRSSSVLFSGEVQKIGVIISSLNSRAP